MQTNSSIFLNGRGRYVSPECNLISVFNEGILCASGDAGDSYSSSIEDLGNDVLYEW